MDTLTDKLSGVLEKLGQAFLIAGYLPSALFILAHQLFLFPWWLGKTIVLFQTPVPEEGADAVWRWTYLIDQGVTALLLPLLLGVLLMALNTIIVKLYEGTYSWQQQFLLRPWQQRNQRRAKEWYGKLVKLKEDYTKVLADPRVHPPGTAKSQIEQKRISIALELQDVHDAIARKAPVQRLPRRTRMVKPTALGNAFAVIEEYPYERYGMDGVLFWPRLRPLLDESYAATLINTKMILDLLLNLSLLALVFGLEAVVVGVWGKLDWALIGAGIGAWVLSYVCYRGAVSTVYSLGDTITVCFDLHWGKLWEHLGFPPPKSLEEEQATWLLLGQFLRRGEGFYYPRLKAASEAAEKEKGSEQEQGG